MTTAKSGILVLLIWAAGCCEIRVRKRGKDAVAFSIVVCWSLVGVVGILARGATRLVLRQCIERRQLELLGQRRRRLVVQDLG